MSIKYNSKIPVASVDDALATAVNFTSARGGNVPGSVFSVARVDVPFLCNPTRVVVLNTLPNPLVFILNITEVSEPPDLLIEIVINLSIPIIPSGMVNTIWFDCCSIASASDKTFNPVAASVARMSPANSTPLPLNAGRTVR